MKNSMANTASRDIQALFEVGSLGGLSDGQLLDRFVARREEAVFEEIVRRHGPMVWGVCRRILRDHHDAEDVFQASFLVLAKKAASVMPREKVGNWLYGVAYQTAMKARAIRAKRRGRENQVLEMPEPESIPAPPDGRLSLLDRELSRLPEKFRIPIILCELEGKTHREAAEQLGWPIGTVSGRLSRARALLARRLSPGGMPVSGGSLGMMLAHDAASAGVPTRLIGATARAAILIATGRSVTAGVVSAGVVTLMEGVIKTMILTKLKDIVILLVLALSCTGLIGTGILMMNRGVSAAGKEAIPAIPESAAPAAKNSAKTASDGVASAVNHDQKGGEDGFSKWTYPNAKPYTVWRSTSTGASVLAESGEYSTVDPFHEVVRFYVEKSGFEPPNWSILGRKFPGDTINLPGSWSQWDKGKAVSIHHHIRPESASAGLLLTDFDGGEAIGVSISCGLGDKRTFIQIARHSTALAKVGFDASRSKKVEPADEEPARKALLSKDLSGTWRGERDGARVEIDFKGGEKATWTVDTSRSKEASATVRADMKMVDDENSGSILLRFDCLRPLPSGKTSLVMGRLVRGRGGELELTMEPDAREQSDSYHQLVKAFPLAPLR